MALSQQERKALRELAESGLFSIHMPPTIILSLLDYVDERDALVAATAANTAAEHWMLKAHEEQRRALEAEAERDMAHKALRRAMFQMEMEHWNWSTAKEPLLITYRECKAAVETKKT